jgi:hypothetical protein
VYHICRQPPFTDSDIISQGELVSYDLSGRLPDIVGNYVRSFNRSISLLASQFMTPTQWVLIHVVFVTELPSFVIDQEDVTLLDALGVWSPFNSLSRDALHDSIQRCHHANVAATFRIS